MGIDAFLRAFLRALRQALHRVGIVNAWLTSHARSPSSTTYRAPQRSGAS